MSKGETNLMEVEEELMKSHLPHRQQHSGVNKLTKETQS